MAAGLGFKTFTTGEVLTAADTNGYLMQGVLVFASSAARAAAITSPQEGQYSYLKDTNSTEYYDGAAWIAAPIGDITGVTAGTGISGGGTSGTVTITNSMATEITAKGDLIAGTGSATFDNLPVGTNGQTLVADSSTATGLKWATPAGGGKVLQVVSATTSSAVTHATAAYTTTGLTATITPTLSTSKILVLTYQAFQASVNSVETANGIQLVRGSTSIAGGVNTTDNMGYYVAGAANTQLRLNHNFSVLDNPATTSATTYLVQARPFSTANAMQIISNYSGQTSSIILLEIGA